MSSTRFVAEVSSNHHADQERCLAFVDAAAACGCGAVKFQQFKIRELFHRTALAFNRKLQERVNWELPEEFNADLAVRAREQGIEYSSTPFYMRAVEVLEPHVDFFKIASYQVLWLDLLREVARTSKPVVLSTGMANLDEVRAAVDTLREEGCANLTLLQCVSRYPTPLDEVNLAAIETLRDEFGCPAGWSDHTVNPEVIVRAVHRFRASTVEFHFDLEGRGEEFPTGHCWLPDQVREMIAAVANPGSLVDSHSADGNGVKQHQECEEHERKWRTDPEDGLRPLKRTRLRLPSSFLI